MLLHITHTFISDHEINWSRFIEKKNKNVLLHVSYCCSPVKNHILVSIHFSSPLSKVKKRLVEIKLKTISDQCSSQMVVYLSFTFSAKKFVRMKTIEKSYFKKLHSKERTANIRSSIASPWYILMWIVFFMKENIPIDW